MLQIRRMLCKSDLVHSVRFACRDILAESVKATNGWIDECKKAFDMRRAA